MRSSAGEMERCGGIEWTRKDISDEHNPFESCPSENRLLRIGSEPSDLHTIVVFVVDTGHKGLVRFESFTATALLGHLRDRKLFSISSPRNKTGAKLCGEVID